MPQGMLPAFADRVCRRRRNLQGAGPGGAATRFALIAGSLVLAALAFGTNLARIGTSPGCNSFTRLSTIFLLNESRGTERDFRRRPGAAEVDFVTLGIAPESPLRFARERFILSHRRRHSPLGRHLVGRGDTQITFSRPGSARKTSENGSPGIGNRGRRIVVRRNVPLPIRAQPIRGIVDSPHVAGGNQHFRRPRAVPYEFHCGRLPRAAAAARGPIFRRQRIRADPRR